MPNEYLQEGKIRQSNKIQPSIEWDSTEEYLALDAKVWYLNYDTEICRPWTKEDEDTVKNFIAYTDSECTNYYDGYPRVEDGNYYIIDGTNPSNYTQIEMPDGIPQEIPDTGKIVLNNETSNASGYVLLFTLEGNPGHVVKYGDKIGKLTISIRAE